MESGIKETRQLISRSINKWFGRAINVHERALQVLERSHLCDDGWMDSAEIYSEALRFQPGLSEMFIRAGIDNKALARTLVDLRDRVTIDQRRTWRADPDIEMTLGFSLPKGGAQFLKVKKSGHLKALDLIVGQLRSGMWDRWGSEVPSLTGHILNCIGVADPDYWTPTNRNHIRDLIGRIQLLERLDTSISDQQFVLYHDGKKYRFRPSSTFGGYQLSEKPLKDGSLWLARGNVIQHHGRFSDEAIELLESLINKAALEKDFQYFFEANPEFLLALGGGKYTNIHPQIILHQDDGGRLIPDFFLEKINDQLCDICDLKLATEKITKNKRNRLGFSGVVCEALAQLEFYRNWFEEKAHRDAFSNRTGLKAYRPRVVLIIGRRQDYYSDVDRIQREALLPNHAELITYDDVVDRAKNYKKIFIP